MGVGFPPAVALLAGLFIFPFVARAQIAQLGVLCEWTSAGGPLPAHKNVLAAVAVANTPHNSTLGAVEILVNSYNFRDGGAAACYGSDPAYYGVIRIVNGQTCALHESISGSPGHRIIASSTPSVADLDNDGVVEIVTLRAPTGIIAWKWDGSQYNEYWNTAKLGITSSWNSVCRWDSVAIHDLNDDGFPEVINAGEVHDGRTGARMNPGQSVLPSVKFSTLADVDNDGTIELIHSSVFEWSPTTNRWVTKYANALPRGASWSGYAVADFGTPGATAAQFDPTTLDGIAEIVGTASGIVGLYTLSGQTIFEVSSGFTGGGPPIIGDFDNDGFPEISQASRSSLTVYDIDCAAPSFGCLGGYVRWRKQSQDFSSSITGSALFQFARGEAPAAVYADECFSRVYQGQTGEVLFSSFRTSCTWCENPVMANTDGVSGTEIIIGSNDNCGIGCPTIDPEHKGLFCTQDSDCPNAGVGSCVAGHCRCTSNADCDSNTRCAASLIGGANTCRAYHPPGVGVTGARVFTDTNGQWQDSEPIWNQHTFTVTNVFRNGTVPRSSQWVQNFAQGIGYQFNNYRANAPLCTSISCVNGQCLGPNLCSCDAGWSGPSCTTATCNPPCQNFGLCVAPDVCDCRISGLPPPTCMAPVTTGTTGQALGGSTSSGVCVSTGTCGTFPDMCGIWVDGCNKQIYCGNCSVGYSSSFQCDPFSTTCTCVPSSCTFPQNRVCGYNVSDGCGGILPQCGTGSCPASLACTPEGVCQPASCNQTVTCASAGYECGDLLNPGPGCIGYSCNQCPGLSVCNETSHTCGCQPLSSCASEGRYCGFYFNGCGFEDCGACSTPGDTCFADGSCTSGPPTTGVLPFTTTDDPVSPAAPSHISWLGTTALTFLPVVLFFEK